MPIKKETLETIARAYVKSMSSIRGRRVHRLLLGATVTTSYDLLKDSLPIVRWTISHPSFAGVTGTLTLSAADVPGADHESVADMLRMLGA